MNIEQALESAYDDIAKSATDPNTNFSQNMKAMFEKQKRQKAWTKAMRTSALERIYPSPKLTALGERYINGEITIKQAIKIYNQ